MRPCVLAILFAVQAACAQSSLPAVTDGDFIFQVSRSSQSLAIQRATGSHYSHMGIVFVRSGKPYVLEAAATVRYTSLGQSVARGEGRHYVVKRLKDAPTLLTVQSLAPL